MVDMKYNSNFSEKDFCVKAEEIDFVLREDKKASVSYRADGQECGSLDGNYRLVPDSDGFSVLLQGKKSRHIEPPEDNTYMVSQHTHLEKFAESIASRHSPTAFGLLSPEIRDAVSRLASYDRLGRSAWQDSHRLPAIHISKQPGWETITRWEVDITSLEYLRVEAKEFVAEDQKDQKAAHSKYCSDEERREQVAKILKG